MVGGAELEPAGSSIRGGGAVLSLCSRTTWMEVVADPLSLGHGMWLSQDEPHQPLCGL